LEDSSPTAVFENLAGAVKSFEGLTYAKVSEVKAQWPIVGRGDVYYGGTTYENTKGVGAHLSAAATRAETVNTPRVDALREKAPRPKENELLAVPVNKLYDRGTTVMMSANLLRERIGGPTIALHPEAAKNLGVEAGQLVNVSFNGVSGDAVVKFDDTISVGVALVPRSMGLSIREPIPASTCSKVECCYRTGPLARVVCQISVCHLCAADRVRLPDLVRTPGAGAHSIAHRSQPRRTPGSTAADCRCGETDL
jgi:hypothetical protein